MRVLRKYLQWTITDAHTAATMGVANQNLWFRKLCSLNIWYYTQYWGIHFLVLIFLSLVVTTPLMWHLMKRVPLTTLYPGVDWSRLVVCVTISLMHTCIIVYFGSMSTSYWSIPQELQRYNFLSEKCLKSSETTHGDMCPCRTFPCFCVAYSRRTFDDV